MRHRMNELRFGPALLAALLAACGARTGLPSESCPVEGAVEACSDACGAGTRVCQNRRWAACEVPVRERPCENDCGQGTQLCSGGEWGSCYVPDRSESCSNDCGEGSRRCSQGSWSECEVAPVQRECRSACGLGLERCVDGVWDACDAPQPKPPRLVATVRDFQDSHPDFERLVPDTDGPELGLVDPELGPDGKPVYAGGPFGTLTTTGRAEFDQWYRDVPGVNQAVTVEIPLSPVPGRDGVYGYDDGNFFPIDGQAFGNDGRLHNYHFTLELHTEFVYRGGETFRFSGDDDLWVFMNGRLVIDLGGLHQELAASVSLDNVSDEVGMVPGQLYPLDLFFAERHTIESNFRIETTIAEFAVCE